MLTTVAYPSLVICLAIVLCGVAISLMTLERKKQIGISEKSSFVIKTVLTSLWLPCVVGTQSYLFLLSSLCSLIYKNSLFLVAALLNYTGVIRVNVFLLLCVDESETEMYEKRNLTKCYSLQNCFNSSRSTFEQKIRICNENEKYEFFLLSFLLLIFLSALSVFASIKLENLTDPVFLYKSTRTFFCFRTSPVVHRSVVFTLASSDSDEHEELLKEVAKDTGMINRPRRGRHLFTTPQRWGLLGAPKFS